ncbi:MAG: hypothetical protein JSS95_16875 [Acidobacteria bacterium]|nr:hypothetical protein [Acidobacteriota bacterium]
MSFAGKDYKDLFGFKGWICCCLLLAAVIATGCGSGGSSGSGNQGGGGNGASADYSLSLQPSSLTVTAGTNQPVTLSAQLSNGFAGSINVSITGLPAGITASPSSFTLQPSGTQIIVFAASGTVVAGPASATIQSSSGTLSHQLQLNLTIKAATPIIPSRSKYLRTDATTSYTSYPPPNWTIFHSPTRRFFASDPYTNHLNVIDSVTQKQISTLVVPGAFGLDQAPDGSVLYVGTMIGDLYVIDPVQLSIIKRYPANTISPYGFSANAVYALSNGKLLLETYNLLPGYSWVDGNGPLALWDPSSNSIVKFVDPSNFDGLMPEKSSCLAGFEYGILTNNRSRILLTPILTSLGSSILCSLDPVSGSWVWSKTLADGGASALASLAVSPDGNTVVASTGTTAYVLDAATLQLKNSFTTKSSQSLLKYPSLVIGPDNQTLYISSGAFVYAYNMSTGALAGWLPNVQLNGAAAPSTPYMQAVSSNGLIAGVLDQGVGLLDINALNTSTAGTPFGPALLSTTYGPIAGGTTTTWQLQTTYGGAPLSSVSATFFGNNLASGVSISTTGGVTISATSPSGVPGVVDVTTLASDGGEQILPEAFSYGPTVLEAPTIYATAEGGGPAQIFGYGFGPNALTSSAQPVVTPPSDLQVQVGTSNAKLTGYLPQAYLANSTFLASPFPLAGIEYIVPPGSAGSSVDITVSNTSGATTLKQAIQYLPAVQVLPATGAKLVDGIYDRRRDLYYFTDTNQIRVFSRSQGKWLNPIAIPAPVGAYGSQRLLGICLSLDGSKMVVSDAGAIAIYIIDPDNPTSIKSYPFASQVFGGTPNIETPSGVAITNSGTVYFTTFDLNGTGAPFLMTLDPSTGRISTYGGFVYTFSSEGPYQYGRLPMSADGARIYLNSSGIIAAIDASTGAVTYPFERTGSIGQGGYEVVLAPSQTNLFADGFMMDSNMNLLGMLALNWRESVDADPVYGATMSTDGGLFFQPNTHSIDVFDARTGVFRSRISLPVALSPSYRALVSDGKDNVQIGITSNGDSIAVIDLGSLPEPPPVAHLIHPHDDENGNANVWSSQSSIQHFLRQETAPLTTGVKPQHRIVNIMQRTAEPNNLSIP